jgi:hypothetical protein
MKWSLRSLAIIIAGSATFLAATRPLIADYTIKQDWGETGGSGLAVPTTDNWGADYQYDWAAVAPFDTSLGTLTSVYVDIDLSQNFEWLEAALFNPPSEVQNAEAVSYLHVNPNMAITWINVTEAKADIDGNEWGVYERYDGAPYYAETHGSLLGSVGEGGWSGANMNFWKDTSYAPNVKIGICELETYLDMWAEYYPCDNHINGSCLATVTVTYNYTP